MEVLLLSGGIESTCLAFMRRPDVCLTVDYGQVVARSEIAAAKNIAGHLGLFHQILTVDLSDLGSGQLAGRPEIAQAPIPEFWPYRNQMLVTLAAMRFAGQDGLVISIGTAKGDEAHRDGTPQFVDKLGSILAMQEGGATLVAPAVNLESIDFLLKSNIDADLLDMTFSCFLADFPCGRCRGCVKNEYLRATYFEHHPSCH